MRNSIKNIKFSCFLFIRILDLISDSKKLWKSAILFPTPHHFSREFEQSLQELAAQNENDEEKLTLLQKVYEYGNKIID